MHRCFQAATMVALAACGALSACTVAPTGPGILALPGAGKSLEQFQADDAECRGYATGRAGAPGGAASTYEDAQRRYDFGYLQCMYAKGHKVPVPGAYAGAPRGNVPPPPPPPSPAAAASAPAPEEPAPTQQP